MYIYIKQKRGGKKILRRVGSAPIRREAERSRVRNGMGRHLHIQFSCIPHLSGYIGARGVRHRERRTESIKSKNAAAAVARFSSHSKIFGFRLFRARAAQRLIGLSDLGFRPHPDGRQDATRYVKARRSDRDFCIWYFLLFDGFLKQNDWMDYLVQ